MGIDEIRSQSQGGRLAPADSGCILCREVGALIGAPVPIQDNQTINVIRRREQESIIRNLKGNEVICAADEDLRARLQELTAGKGVERAIDCVAGELGAEIVRNLAPAGTMLVFGAQSSADGPREIHHAALRSAYDLFDNDGSRVVASASGEFPAAR